jgi:TRAP-type transport system periplasmic protein
MGPMPQVVAGLFLVCSFLVASGGPLRAAQTWNMPLAWGLTNIQVVAAQRFADKVRELTKGELNIVIHPGGALGYKGPEMLSVVRDGLVPVGDILLNQQVGIAPFLGIESVPYLAPSFLEVRALQTFARPVYESIAKKHN